MADKLRIVYSEVLKAASIVSEEAHAIGSLHDHLAADTDQLHHAGLRGYTSDAWYKDMHETLLPKTKELAAILESISEIIKVLAKLFQDTEQESAQVFKKQSGNWLTSIAQAMGQQLDQQAARVQDLAQRGTSTPESMDQLKAESQKLSQMQDALSNVIKSMGEGMQNAAQKQ